MRVEILGLDDNVARCRVSDGTGRVIEFTCGAGSEAHDLLRLMIRNAARELAEAKTREIMESFRADARRF